MYHPLRTEAQITITDIDANSDETAQEIVDVVVTNLATTDSITVICQENSVNSDKFNGAFDFVIGGQRDDEDQILNVTIGDSIIVKYWDESAQIYRMATAVIDEYTRFPADVNADGWMDIRDLQIIAKHFGEDTSNREDESPWDVTADGIVDAEDVREFIQYWGMRVPY